MHRTKTIFVYLLLCIGMRALAIETNTISYKIESLKDIPENDINCIHKDKKGFLWLGSLDGLFRFDGYNYKTYRISSNTNDNSSLISSNLIIDIDEDSQGNIWIATYGKGICKLDPKTDKFTHFNYNNTNERIPDDITTLLIDHEDNIWLGNWFGALRVKLNKQKDLIDQVDDFSAVLPSIEDSEIKEIIETSDKCIWVGTNTHTHLIRNPQSPLHEIEFKTFPCFGESLCEYESGVLASGYQTHAISLDKDNTNYTIELIEDRLTTAITHYKNKIYIGSRNGLRVIKKNNNKWETETSLSCDFSKQSLSSNIITSIESDKNGTIWIATRGGGVNTIRQNNKNFHHFKKDQSEKSLGANLVRFIFEDSKENLWIGTEERGMSLLKNNTPYQGPYEVIDVNRYMADNRVYSIAENSTPQSKKQNRLIWIGTGYPDNLKAIDPDNLRFKIFKEGINQIGFVFALAFENDTTLWAGTYGNGLWRLTLNDEGDIVSRTQYHPNQYKQKSLLSHIVRSLHFDTDGNLWIGTDKGINKVLQKDLKNKLVRFESYKLGTEKDQLPHDYILQICEVDKGEFYIGTMGGGLLHLVEKDGKTNISSITTKHGLPNNCIKAIVNDDNYLWLTTNLGLSRLNILTKEIVNYDKYDGLQEMEFSEMAAIKRKNNEIVAGGINGFNVFRSNEIGIDTDTPKLYFTDFFILNKQVKPGARINGKIVLEKSIEQTKQITLKYSQNSFSTEFVGLHYNAPQKNNYEYKLEGFDKNWISSSADYRIAKYTNIPSGEYILKVRASNCDNLWTSKPIELAITILPPPYLSPFAILIYILLTTVLTYCIFRINQISEGQKRQILISEIEKNKIEELSAMKLQFFTNISHELRTPLSLIKAPLETLSQKGHIISCDERKYNQTLIKKNVDTMSRLINQLMDFRKLDRNKLDIMAQEEDVVRHIQTIFEQFLPLAKQKDIQLFYDTDNNLIPLWIDIEKIEIVLYNLLSNAIKFTPSKGVIQLKVEENKEKVTISVYNSGSLIKEEEKAFIFERYYQAKSNTGKHYGGTGIGLALSKGIIELHQGTIAFENSSAKYSDDSQLMGVTFKVELLKGKEHLPASAFGNKGERKENQIEPSYTISDELSESIVPKQWKDKDTPTVLIVEDNKELRTHLAIYLAKEFNILQAENGRIGLEKCNKFNPDLVITDIMMPEMDGMEMCKRIKEEEKSSHIPVLLLSAKTQETTQVDGFTIGADAFVEKPFSTEVLLARAKSLIQNRRNLQARFQKEIQINPKLISNNPIDKVFLDKILMIIEEHLSDSEFSVEQLAEKYGVSRIYLNRKIKALTGETSNQFIRNIRLKHAAELLRTGSLNVSEVTWQVGYTDLRTFRKRFKEVFNVTPSEYAKNGGAVTEVKNEPSDRE